MAVSEARAHSAASAERLGRGGLQLDRPGRVSTSKCLLNE